MIAKYDVARILSQWGNFCPHYFILYTDHEAAMKEKEREIGLCDQWFRAYEALIDKKNAALANRDKHEEDYQHIITEILLCDPITAEKYIDGTLEPPWKVVKRIREERADLLKKLEDAKGEIEEQDRMRATIIAEIKQDKQQLADLRAKLAAAEKAIKWALGEVDDFPPRENGEGAYWWRKELRKRAGLQYRYIRDKRILEADHAD